MLIDLTTASFFVLNTFMFCARNADDLRIAFDVSDIQGCILGGFRLFYFFSRKPTVKLCVFLQKYFA